MDDFHHWVLSHWVTLAAAQSLLLNLILALLTKRRQLVFGAIGLLCAWLSTIASLMLLKDLDGIWARLVIDILAVAFFYRVAERDLRSGERHDWAALICIFYVFLLGSNLYALIFPNEHPNLLIAVSNVIFWLKIMANSAPSLFLLLVI